MKKLVITLALSLALLAPVSAYAHGDTGEYTVIDGDLSLWSIALKLDINFGALLDENQDQPMLATCLRVGDKVQLP